MTSLGLARRSRSRDWLRIVVVVLVVAIIVTAVNLALFWPENHTLTRSGTFPSLGGFLAPFDVPSNTVIHVAWTTQPSGNILLNLNTLDSGTYQVVGVNGTHGSFTYSTYSGGGGTFALAAGLLSSNAGPVTVSAQIEYTTTLASQL